MSRRPAGLAAALASVIALPGLSAAAAAGPLDAYLPKSGVIEGRVVTLGIAPEDEAIDRQFRTAVVKNIDWFKRAVTGNRPGQALPYDRRMGITQAQYDRLQHMKADVHPGATISIRVTRAADGTVSFSGTAPAAAGLDKVTFPADEASAATPYGKLDILNTIHQDDPSAPLGAWTGAEWARVAPEHGDSPSAKIAFGKRSPSGEGVMYYQVAPFADRPEQSMVVLYKLD